MYRYSQYGRRIIYPNVSPAPLASSVSDCNELGKSRKDRYSFRNYVNDIFIETGAPITNTNLDTILSPTTFEIDGFKTYNKYIKMFLNIRFIKDALYAYCIYDAKMYSPNFLDGIRINGLKPTFIHFDLSEHESYKYSLSMHVTNPLWLKLTTLKLELRNDYVPCLCNVVTVNKIVTKKHFDLILMSTVCIEKPYQDDFALIPQFVKYYSEVIGIQHFYLYYNGSLDDVHLPQLENVTYIEWNYPYNAKTTENGCFIHCSQIGSVNDLLSWAKQFSKYIMFVDLDEFVYWNNSIPLIQYILNQNYKCYGMRNVFTALKNSSTTVSYNENWIKMLLNNDFEVIPTICEFQFRSKCIVRTDIKLMGVHKIVDPIYTDILEETLIFDPDICGFHHIYNFSERTRFSGLELSW